MDAHVRRLGPEDAAQAAALVLSLKASERPPLSLSQMQAWLSRPSNILIEATANGTPVGFALGYLLDRVDTARPMLFFYEIEVAASHRRRGIGTQMVEHMKAIALEEDAVKMWVQTSPQNVAARQMYRRAGAVEAKSCDLLYGWTNPARDEPERPPDEAESPTR